MGQEVDQAESKLIQKETNHWEAEVNRPSKRRNVHTTEHKQTSGATSAQPPQSEEREKKKGKWFNDSTA